MKLWQLWLITAAIMILNMGANITNENYPAAVNAAAGIYFICAHVFSLIAREDG
jgi:pyrrolidone-carboxylate peptidase